MKLSLLLALVVLVSVSQQQQRSYDWSSRYLPAAYFSRNTFARPGLNYNYFNSQEPFDDEEGSYDDESELPEYPDIQARRPAFGGSISKAFNSGSRNKPQKKLFVPNNFLSLANAFGSGLSISTSTTTNYVIVTATATVATVQSCIGAAQFSTLPGAPPVTTLTQPCSRRRRLAAEIADSLQESSVTIIEPSSVAPSETSAAPSIPSSNRRNYQFIQPSGDISSSITDQDLYSQEQRQLLQPRVQSSFKVVVTVSSTFTSYAFATTTIKKSFTVGNTAPAGLVCLPAGYTIC